MLPTRAVFSNIIDNAIKFTPEKGEIAIKLYRQDEWVEISILNDSYHLPKTDPAQIFEPFYRSEDPPIAGYGLGLAIAKKIVELHKGTIEAQHQADSFEILIRFPVRAS